MATEFIQRQIERLLGEAAEAIAAGDWAAVQRQAISVLRLDPANADALALIEATSRAPGGEAAPAAGSLTTDGERSQPQPASFVSGRYQVVRLLGEGATKRVYLAHDTMLDRDVAFAVIKTDGLDTDGLTRIRREAQSMARLGDHPNIVAVFDIGDEAGQP